MIKLEVEGYCHNCLDFTPSVIPPVRKKNDNGEVSYSDAIVQCEYKRRCSGIERYLRQQTKDEASG